jgi:diguanylate cyclase (GGDEF)-like protein
MPLESAKPGASVRSKPRGPRTWFRKPLLPTGSPFGWNARDRSLYVQFLTALLLAIVVLAFAGFRGWPFLAGPPRDETALRTTTSLAVIALVFWLGLYAWTKQWYAQNGARFSWLLLFTVAAHIVTGTSVCYAIGPYSAASGMIMVAALLIGMVLLERRWLWLAVAAWFGSMLLVHLGSVLGALPFLALFDPSTGEPNLAIVASDHAMAVLLISAPLAVVMDHLIGVWRQDERSLHEAAQLDSLTGAYTRGFAVSLMERALRKATGADTPLGILMLDLDHFKRVNDAHGHALGDVVLARTTQAMQGALRGGDVVGRFGGEEFVVLLPGADLKQAIGAAERCRVAVAKMEIPEAPYLSVTASVGVAAYPGDGADLDELLKAADLAMYAAKAKGRNRVETAHER